jgi:hypothetical protein
VVILARVFSPLKDYFIPILWLGIAAVFIGHGYLRLFDLQAFAGLLEQARHTISGTYGSGCSWHRALERSRNSSRDECEDSCPDAGRL